MAQSKVNLAKLFGNVAQELAKNQSALNQADTQNNDHGNNMVNVFNTITQAMQEKPKASPSSQLAYASEQVRENCQSGSGTVYADGLARAAAELQGQSISGNNAMQLITALMGTNLGGQTSTQSGGGDALGSLLGTMMGGGATPQQSSGSGDALGSLLGSVLGGGSAPQQQSSASGDALGSLLGSVLGGGSAPQQSSGTNDALGSMLGGLLGGEQTSGQSSSAGGISMQQVLAAGLEFMQSQQQGQDTMSSLLDAVLAGSQAGGGYRAESGKLVAGTLMQGLGALLGKK